MIVTEGADLVIGMTREHLRAAISLEPTCWPRAFTFRELVRRTSQLATPPTSWEDWLAVCHDGRNLGDLIVPEPTDDLPDPPRPVTTVSPSRGICTCTFLRLCSRAPATLIHCLINPFPFLTTKNTKLTK